MPSTKNPRVRRRRHLPFVLPLGVLTSLSERGMSSNAPKSMTEEARDSEFLQRLEYRVCRSWMRGARIDVMKLYVDRQGIDSEQLPLLNLKRVAVGEPFGLHSWSLHPVDGLRVPERLAKIWTKFDEMLQ